MANLFSEPSKSLAWLVILVHKQAGYELVKPLEEELLNSRIASLLVVVLAMPLYVNAQWAVYHDPTVPRTRDGKPNLSAPAPRLNGKPDLSGIWQPESAPVAEIQQFLLPGGINGLGEDLPTKYFFNIFADYPAGQEPMRPEVRAQLENRPPGPGRPPTLCPLPTLPLEGLVPAPFKIVQTPRLTMVLYEADTVFRQIFSDGRALPSGPATQLARLFRRQVDGRCLRRGNRRVQRQSAA